MDAWDSARLTGLQEVYLGPLKASILAEPLSDDHESLYAICGPPNVCYSHVMPLLTKILFSGSNAMDTGTVSPPIEVLGLCTCFDLEDIRNSIVLQALADTFKTLLQSQTHHPVHAQFEPIPLPFLRKLCLFNVYTDCSEATQDDEDTLREWARDAFPALVGARTARGVAVEVKVKMCSQLDWKMRLMNSTSSKSVF